MRRATDAIPGLRLAQGPFTATLPASGQTVPVGSANDYRVEARDGRGWTALVVHDRGTWTAKVGFDVRDPDEPLATLVFRLAANLGRPLRGDGAPLSPPDGVRLAAPTRKRGTSLALLWTLVAVTAVSVAVLLGMR